MRQQQAADRFLPRETRHGHGRTASGEGAGMEGACIVALDSQGAIAARQI